MKFSFFRGERVKKFLCSQGRQAQETRIDLRARVLWVRKNALLIYSLFQIYYRLVIFTKMEKEWIEYHCGTGQTLFLYNKVTGEHKWAHDLGEVSHFKTHQIDFCLLVRSKFFFVDLYIFDMSFESFNVVAEVLIISNAELREK